MVIAILKVPYCHPISKHHNYIIYNCFENSILVSHENIIILFNS